MTDVISSLNDPRLPEITQYHWYKFWKTYEETPHITIYDFETYKRVESTATIPFWQGIHLSKLHDEKVDEIITHTIQRFKEINKPWRWCVGPVYQPSNLPDSLIQHGFELKDVTPYLGIELNHLPEPDSKSSLKIVLVEDEKDFKAFSEAVAIGYGAPFMEPTIFEMEIHPSLSDLSVRRRYVGYEDGVPVCGASLMIDSGVAGIYQVATIPETRGKGYGTAITLAPLLDALELGMKIGVLHSSEMGYNLYKRMGFKDIATCPIYSLP